jgi:NAD(P)-dependent dehydrogenase (short-subunit alcohol dehydrogenase family)
MSTSIRLDGRTALVTGGSRGIGYAVASALHEQGAAVALLARDGVAAKDAADRLIDGGRPDSALAVPVDVRDGDAVDAAVRQVHAWTGRLDIVVNCAGPRLNPAPLGQTPVSVLADALDTKLLGFLRVAQAALPLLETTGSGRIINIAGATAHSAVPGSAVTGVTNASVVALTSYLATEAAERNILVNTVSPGMTLTEGWLEKLEGMAAQQGRTEEDVRTGMAQTLGIRLGRWAQPTEIAATVAYLASDLASYVTGQVVRVDGGLTRQVA